MLMMSSMSSRQKAIWFSVELESSIYVEALSDDDGAFSLSRKNEK